MNRFFFDKLVGMIDWITIAVFGPIYATFSKIQ
jgi:hypothetical protein